MDRLTTPDERFADLPDFDVPFTTIEVADPTGGAPLSMGVVDTGPTSTGETVVLLHGEPS
jgi:haloalkane dehalogenase